MKLANLVKFKVASVVDDGAPLDNYFTSKKYKKPKAKVPSVKKGPYGVVGFGPGYLSGDAATGGDAGDAGGGDGGGGGGD